ncbi:MAG TPA: hypothetical protein VKP61_00765 [Candidatus Acidoferrum sp.]|nr:hypothetical protein [Candidatus Acidoferrum sp.]
MSRKAALSTNSLTLPSTPAVKLEIVGGRQRVVRVGIFFALVGRNRRAVYEQLDGQIVLADECKCRIDYPDKFFPDDMVRGPSFIITPSPECPIDCHKALGLRLTEAS